MRTFKKRIIYALLASLLVLVLLLVSGRVWLKHYAWRGISTKAEMERNGLALRQTPNLPPRFYEVYDLLHPKQRRVGMLGELWLSITDPHSGADCKCDSVGYLAWNNHDAGLAVNVNAIQKWAGYWKFGIGLERYASPEKCFDFWVNYDIRWRGGYLENLDELSQKTMGKDVAQLDDDETIKLIAWRDCIRFGRADSLRAEQRYQVLERVYESRVGDGI